MALIARATSAETCHCMLIHFTSYFSTLIKSLVIDLC